MVSDQELIDKYIRAELSVEEQDWFEQRKADNGFAALLEEHLHIGFAIKEIESDSIRSVLQDEEQKLQSNPKASNSILKWLLIALLFLVVGSIAYFAMKKSAPSQPQYFAQYYKPFPNIIDPIVKGDNASPSIYQQYELENYQDVITALSKKEELDEGEIFYLANSFLALNDFENAKIYYNQVLDSDQFDQHAMWYLGLICLKEDGKQCYKYFGSELLKEDQYYGKKVEEIMSRIDE